MSDLILPFKPSNDGDVRRGREVVKAINDKLGEFRERGMIPLEIRVSREAADYMRAFFQNFAQSFDGVLPPSVQGVPFVIGQTEQGKPLQFALPTGKTAH